VLTHGSTLRCHGPAPADCEAQPGDCSQPTEQAAPGVPRCPYLPACPDPYASLTSAELVAFGIDPAHVSDDDDEETEDDK
jgi:hypothetical protein